MADQRKSEDPFLGSLQKLDDELTCPVCSDHFTEPKVLPCLHFYCKTCIADLIKRAKGRPFTCPECRRETNAEEDNPDNLPTAFFVNRMEELFSVMKKAERKDSVTCESCRSQLPAADFCHDCSKYICTDCAKAHRQMWLLSSHSVVSIDSLRSTISKNPPEKLQVFSREVKCSKHKDEPLKLYCHDCSKLVCRDCIVIDHKDHEYAFVIDAAPLCKAEIQEKSESVKKITEGVKLAVISLGESRKKLSDHGIATTRAIDQAIDEIVAKLAEKRREMKEKASRIVSEAEEEIAAQEKNAQLAVGELVSLQEFMSRSLETETDQEILSLKKQVSDQVERVGELYSDADRKFPLPELPELVVKCGERVNQAIETELSVAQRELEEQVAIVTSFEEHEEVIVKDEEVTAKDEEVMVKDEEVMAKDEEVMVKDEEVMVKDEERTMVCTCESCKSYGVGVGGTGSSRGKSADYTRGRIATREEVAADYTRGRIATREEVAADYTGGRIATREEVAAGYTGGRIATREAVVAGYTGGRIATREAVAAGYTGGRIATREAELTVAAEPVYTREDVACRTIWTKYRAQSPVSQDPIEEKTVSQYMSHERSMSHSVPFPHELIYKTPKRRSQRKY